MACGRDDADVVFFGMETQGVVVPFSAHVGAARAAHASDEARVAGDDVLGPDSGDGAC